MKDFYVDFEGKHYRVIVRDDHPALIYLGNDMITSIYPFHSERQTPETMAKTIRDHLAQIE